MEIKSMYTDLIENCISTGNLDILEKSKEQFELWSKSGKLTPEEVEIYTMICLALDNKVPESIN